MESVIRLACGKCGRKLKVRAAAAGSTLDCPECGAPCRVPNADAPPAAPAAAPAAAEALEATPARRVGWIAGAVVGVVAVGGVLAAMFLPRGAGDPAAQPGGAQSAASNGVGGGPAGVAPASAEGSASPPRASRYGGSIALGAALPQQPVPRAPYQEPVRGLVGVLGEGRFRHFKQVRNFALSPDGRYLATDTQSSDLWMWDAETGTPLWVLTDGKHHEANALMTFSPDGQTLAVFGNENQAGKSLPDGVLRLIDVPTGQTRVRRDGYLMFLKNNFGKPPTLKFSPDGRLLLLDMGLCYLVDAETGEDSVWMTRFAAIPGSSQKQLPALSSVHFTPDGRHIALPVANPVGPNTPRNPVTGNLVTSAAFVVFDQESGEETCRLEDTKSLGVQIAERAPLLEIYDRSTQEHQIRDVQGRVLWKHSNRQRRGSFTLLDSERLVFFEALQRNLETASSVHLVNFRTGETHPITEPHVSTSTPQTFQLFGSRILGCTRSDPYRALLYDLDERKLLLTIPGEEFSDWSGVTVSADGRFAAIVERSPKRDRSQLRLYDLVAGAPLHTFQLQREGGGKGVVDKVSFSPDATRVYASVTWQSSAGGEVAVWTLPDGQRQFQSPNASFNPGQIVFAPNGGALAAAARDDGRVLAWNLQDGTARVAFGTGDDVSAKPAQALALSPDGGLLFVENATQRRIIELAASQPRVRFTTPGIKATDAEFTADGAGVVSRGALTDAQTGEVRPALGVQTNHAALALRGFAFSPEHRAAAGVSEAGVVTLLSLAQETPTAIFKAPFGVPAILAQPLRLALWIPAKRGLALIDLQSDSKGLTYPGASIEPGREYQSDQIVTAQQQFVPLEDDRAARTGEHRLWQFLGGDRLAEVRSIDGLLKVWDAHTGRLVFSASVCPPKPDDLGVDYAPFAALAGTYDGRYVAVALNNGQILLVDTTAPPLDPSDRPAPPPVAVRPAPPAVAVRPAGPTPQPGLMPGLPAGEKPQGAPAAGQTPPAKPARPLDLDDPEARRLRDVLQPKSKFDGRWSYEKYAANVSFRVTAATPDGQLEAVLFDPATLTQTKSMVGKIVRAADENAVEVEWTMVRDSGVRRPPARTPATINLLLFGDERTLRLRLADNQLTGTDSVGVKFVFTVR